MKCESIAGLTSKTQFRVKQLETHLDKSVANYLKEWTKGNAVIPTDWHMQIDNGKITNNHNNGLIVGRK